MHVWTATAPRRVRTPEWYRRSARWQARQLSLDDDRRTTMFDHFNCKRQHFHCMLTVPIRQGGEREYDSSGRARSVGNYGFSVQGIGIRRQGDLLNGEPWTTFDDLSRRLAASRLSHRYARKHNHNGQGRKQGGLHKWNAWLHQWRLRGPGPTRKMAIHAWREDPEPGTLLQLGYSVPFTLRCELVQSQPGRWHKRAIPGRAVQQYPLCI